MSGGTAISVHEARPLPTVLDTALVPLLGVLNLRHIKNGRTGAVAESFNHTFTLLVLIVTPNLEVIWFRAQMDSRQGFQFFSGTVEPRQISK